MTLGYLFHDSICVFFAFILLPTWWQVNDLRVSRLVNVCVKTAAVPHSLEGAQAGPQRGPGPDRSGSCQTHRQIGRKIKMTVFHQKQGQLHPPLKQPWHRQTPGTCTLSLSKFQQLKLGDLLLKPGQLWTLAPQRQRWLAGRAWWGYARLPRRGRCRPRFRLVCFIWGVKIWWKRPWGLGPSSRCGCRNVVVSQTCKDCENIHIATFRK